MHLLKAREAIAARSETPRRTLIVNADDFGMTPGVNAGVIAAFDQGIVTSVSLLAGGDAFTEAVARLHQASGLAVGVHLCLTEGRPVAPPAEVPSLLRADGRFPDSAAAFLRRFAQGKIRLADVEREFHAQIRKVLDHGLRVEKLDSHMHLHVLPPIFDVVLRVGRALGITTVRLAREPFRFWEPRPADWAKGFALAGLSLAYARTLRRRGFRAADHLLGLSASGQVTEARLLRWLRALPVGTTELMVHPGYVDAPLRAMPASHAYRRDEEVTALTSARVRALVDAAGIRLGTFATLADAP